MNDPNAVRVVDPAEAYRRLTDPAVAAAARPLLVDVREPNEFVAVRAEGAVLLPLSRFVVDHPALPSDRPLLMICHSGARSHNATAYLQARGWPDVTNVAGGTAAWERAGLPVRRGMPAAGEGDLPG